mmetsp:Transcript_23914/g.35911  ORF Transcript_23914/g.35911 Transcript_23914/m.35911 type:complete len:338 (-) Transcript_23914:357-1370(-)
MHECLPVLNRVAQVCAGFLIISLILRIKGFRKRKKNNRQSRATSRPRSDMRTRIRRALTSADNISVIVLVIWIVYALVTAAFFRFSDSIAEFFRVCLIGYGIGYTASGLFLASKFLAITPNLANSGSARTFKLFLIGVCFYPLLLTVPSLFLLKSYKEETTDCFFPAMPSSFNVAFALFSAAINACGFKLFRKPFRYILTGDITASSGHSATKQIVQRNFISMCITGSSTIVFQTSLAIAGDKSFLFKNVAMPLSMVDIVMNSVSINIAFGDLWMLWCCHKSSAVQTCQKRSWYYSLQSRWSRKKINPTQDSLENSKKEKQAKSAHSVGSGSVAAAN